ncbi:MAG: cyclic nucleotide-binding domain-containing protein [Candidatus Rifleibacteriota bacterium]
MIPIISSEKDYFEKIVSYLESSEERFEFVHIDNSQDAAEFMRVEMPELLIVDFSDDRLGVESLFHTIKSDPWLFTSGIVLICEAPETTRKLDLIKGTNILSIVDKSSIKSNLPHILRIIFHNRHMLFQGVVGADLGNNISASFKLDNSALQADVFVNLISNYLYSISRIDACQKDQLVFVLHELLINAIEHGNCAITYEEKTEWLENGSDINDLLAKKCEDPEIAKRKVILEYHIHNDFTSFKIQDQGVGFDWQKMPEHFADSGELSLHGRGIALCRGMTRNLHYNQKGNVVKFDFMHQRLAANSTPALFEDLDTVNFSKGDLVFKQGDPGNHLYYITQGKYEILVDNTQVSTLDPDDVFVGEMSFLLNNHRSATVRALTDGSMIRITRKEFIDGIKEKPHYSIFIARLLAKRLERLNHKLGVIQSHI